MITDLDFKNTFLDLVPRKYEVLLVKDGFRTKRIYYGNQRDCQEYVRIVRKGRQGFWNWAISDSTDIFLRDGFTLKIRVIDNG
jgi:hypothetical protein